MRLAVLDAGSSAVNLLIADSLAAVPLSARGWKVRMCLAQMLKADGSVTAAGRRQLTDAVGRAMREARRAGVDEILPYATAVVRDAPNGEQALHEVAEATGLRLGVLSGVEEAQLTFLAARRWMGWRTGPMLLADIGGGSLEVAVGPDRLPEVALSVPLGARALTREFLSDGDPPSARAVKRLRRHVRAQIGQFSPRTPWDPQHTAVATSRTFQQLARLTGAAPLRQDPFVKRRLRRPELHPWIGRLATMPVAERSRLPGVSAHRARQILAGAIVGYELMRRLDIDTLRICPWALREGILLRRLEAHQPPLHAAGWTRLGSA